MQDMHSCHRISYVLCGILKRPVRSFTARFSSQDCTAHRAALLKGNGSLVISMSKRMMLNCDICGCRISCSQRHSSECLCESQLYSSGDHWSCAQSSWIQNKSSQQVCRLDDVHGHFMKALLKPCKNNLLRVLNSLTLSSWHLLFKIEALPSSLPEDHPSHCCRQQKQRG